ncbi:D-glycero-beta-D-manno-heptose 1,7-bisphosphate 7-phosphatase [Thalassotalea profundi]|uniref:D,D-heptose 1,7-bisphosphate phosphatase n=1 Tax=Thalassotalea profundi TaxID=2036687 RepID=A0ABQ3III2_9GAMM|nr:D-glycero-beta-D-manno-heptose 1,7-bisphosphate 7-phosphatase [Thalassotalea profundi]GHE79405.1 D,D-heptose 1,7-bisphosphate phosphatase [Thalassotalea profundi]
MTKALFLDRDGIINIDHGYVYKSENFEFVDGIFKLCQYAMSKGYIIVVITNQSGIGRGKYTTEQFEQLTLWMIKQFNKNNVSIKDVYYCPHHPTKGIGDYLQDCSCRKPKPGMINLAATDHDIELANSIFIGDKVSDMQAAEAAGIHNRVLVASQYDDTKQIIAHRVDNITQAYPFIK